MSRLRARGGAISKPAMIVGRELQRRTSMTRAMAISLTAGLPLMALVLGGSARPSPATSAAERAILLHESGLDSTMWTTMRNVDLRVGMKADEGGAMRVRTLRGRVVPTQPG